MTRWTLIFHFCLLWNAVVNLTELHLPCLVHCPWEALNCWRGRTERSFALNVTSPNVIYTAHWETDKAFKVLFCYPNRRKYPALNLASKTYHSLENCHRGNVSEKLPEQHLPGASNLSRKSCWAELDFRANHQLQYGKSMREEEQPSRVPLTRLLHAKPRQCIQKYDAKALAQAFGSARKQCGCFKHHDELNCVLPFPSPEQQQVLSQAGCSLSAVAQATYFTHVEVFCCLV